MRELTAAHRQRVQVAGIRRGMRRILSPGADEVVLAHDELLVLGAPAQIGAFKDWLNEAAGGAG